MGRIARLCYGTGVSLRTGRLPSFAGAKEGSLPRRRSLFEMRAQPIYAALGYHGTDGKREICKEALYGDGDAQ